MATPAQDFGRLAETNERGPCLLRLGDQPADRHEAAQLQGFAPGQRIDRGGQIGSCESGFRRIVVDVDLEQDGQARPGPDLARHPVQPSAELDGVDGLDDIEDFGRSTGLVRLQRPDEMPGGVGQGLGLVGRLLDTILAEGRQADLDRRPKPIDGDGLGDGDQGDLGRVTTRHLAGGADPGEDSRARTLERVDVARVHVGGIRWTGHRCDYFRRRKLGISRSSAS